MQLSDEELEQQLNVLLMEKSSRDEVRRQAARVSHLDRMRVLQQALTLGVIDALEPKHTAGRYGDVCSDAVRSGASRRNVESKDYDCHRCRLFWFLEFDDEMLAGTSARLDLRF